jgi:hypothetical protein
MDERGAETKAGANAGDGAKDGRRNETWTAAAGREQEGAAGANAHRARRPGPENRDATRRGSPDHSGRDGRTSVGAGRRVTDGAFSVARGARAIGAAKEMPASRDRPRPSGRGAHCLRRLRSQDSPKRGISRRFRTKNGPAP